MKKIFIWIGVIIVLVFLILFLYKSKASAPVIGDIVYTNASADLIQVELPYPDAVVGKEFSVLGKARGTWFFEASFPVVLLDKDGQVLAQGAAQAQGEWMTTEFVPFKIDLKVTNNDYIGKGTLILKKDNPSGDSVRDASVSFEINVEY